MEVQAPLRSQWGESRTAFSEEVQELGCRPTSAPKIEPSLEVDEKTTMDASEKLGRCRRYENGNS